MASATTSTDSVPPSSRIRRMSRWFSVSLNVSREDRSPSRSPRQPSSPTNEQQPNRPGTHLSGSVQMLNTDAPCTSGQSASSTHKGLVRQRSAIVRRRPSQKSLKERDKDTENVEQPTPSPKRNPQGRRMSKHLSLESSCWSQNFSSKQLRAIQMTWMRLTKEQTNSRPNSVRLTERVFDYFKKRQPLTGSIFAKAACVEGMLRNFDENRAQRKMVSFRDHSRVCCDLLEAIVLSVYSNTPLPEEYDLDTIGRRHGCLSVVGFVPQMWEQLGECMVEVLIGNDGLQAHPEGKKAWMTLVAFIIDRMRNGYEREVGRQKRLAVRQESINQQEQLQCLQGPPLSSNTLSLPVEGVGGCPRGLSPVRAGSVSPRARSPRIQRSRSVREEQELMESLSSRSPSRPPSPSPSPRSSRRLGQFNNQQRARTVDYETFC